MKRLKRLGRLLLDYAELLIAVVAVVVVTVLGLVGEIDNERLTQVAVGLLAALAIAIIRERVDRRASTDRIDDSLAMFNQVNRPWQVLDEKLVWDLSEGNRAIAIAKKEFQFMQNEVFSVYEYQYKPVGDVISHSCRGGAKGEPMQILPIIHREFPGPEGRVYRLISLERLWRRGEVMMFQSTRELKDCFPKERESVSKDVTVPTSRVSMCVKWPEGRKPTALWVERGTGPRVGVDVDQIKCSGGQWIYTEVIPDPRVGERIIVGWDWPQSQVTARLHGEGA